MNELFAYFHSLRIELSYTTFMKRSHLCRSCKCSSTYTTDISFYFFTIDMYISNRNLLYGIAGLLYLILRLR